MTSARDYMKGWCSLVSSWSRTVRLSWRMARVISSVGRLSWLWHVSMRPKILSLDKGLRPKHRRFWIRRFWSCVTGSIVKELWQSLARTKSRKFSVFSNCSRTSPWYSPIVYSKTWKASWTSPLKPSTKANKSSGYIYAQSYCPATSPTALKPKLFSSISKSPKRATPLLRCIISMCWSGRCYTRWKMGRRRRVCGRI